MKLTRGQLLLCLAGMIVSVGIFLLPGKSTKEPKQDVAAASDNKVSFETWMDSSLNAIKANQIIVADLEEKLSTSGESAGKTAIADSLSKIMLENQQPWLAAEFQLKKAEITNNAEDWNQAGMTFYKASKFAPPVHAPALTDKAIQAYSRSLEINPSNLDVKTSMGICFVENGKDPMKGIGMLREVLQSDPENITAHMNLGYFSIQSGQYEKAIERFEKVLQLRPEMIEAYLYLGESYAGLGRKDKAIEVLEQYKTKSGDDAIKAEVDHYINELKTS